MRSSRFQIEIFCSSVFLIYITIFIFNNTPSAIYWGDDGYLISSAMTLGLGHPPGHPSYMLIERLIAWMPVGSIATRFNYFSIIAVSLTGSLIVFWCLSRIRSGLYRFAPAILAGSIFLVHPFIWHQSGRSETYALHLLLLMIAIVSFINTKKISTIYIGSFISGLLAGNQLLLAACAAPGLLYLWIFRIIKGKHYGKTIVYSIIFAIMGLSVYMYIPLRSRQIPRVIYQTAHSKQQFISYATAQDYQKQFFDADSNNKNLYFFKNLKYFFEEFHESTIVLICALLGLFIGIYRFQNDVISFFLIAVFTLLGSISCKTFNLVNWDFQGYLSPVILIIALLAGIFMSELATWSAKHRWITVLLICIATLPLMRIPTLIKKSTLNNHNFARMYGLSFLEGAQESSILFSSSDVYFILKYLQTIEKYRTDIDVVSLNKLFRIRDKQLLTHLYPKIQFPDPAMMDNEHWIRQLVNINSQYRAMEFELADKNDLFGRDITELRGPVGCLTPKKGTIQHARNLNYFKKYAFNIPSFTNDHNAVEQVSTILYNRGTYFLRRDHLIQALVEFESAVKLDPFKENICNNLGVTLAKLNMKKTARIYLLRALTLNPDHSGAKRNLMALEKSIQ